MVLGFWVLKLDLMVIGPIIRSNLEVKGFSFTPRSGEVSFILNFTIAIFRASQGQELPIHLLSTADPIYQA